MAQLTRPLILPQKPKHAARPQRSSLLFPFAAVVAVALVGFSLLSFNPPPDFQQQVPPVNPGSETATPTPVPYVQPATDVMPSEVPTLIGPTFVPTVPPYGNPTLVPSLLPGGTEPLQSGAPSVIVPIYCEGITRGTPQTHLFTRPFASESGPIIIGLYESNVLVPINDVAKDSDTGEVWYYVGDSNSVINQGDQGWTSSANIELMWNCSEELGLLEAKPAQAGVESPLSSTATPFPMVEISPTATPLPMTAMPITGNFEATASPTPVER